MDKIRVLLVEDEPTLAMIIKDTLDGEEFEVILAANGEEGLSRYREAKPDIIVTDIMMPKIDGFTMVRHIRKTDRQIPVLFLSARSAANDVVEGFELLPEKAVRHGGTYYPYQGIIEQNKCP